MGITNFIYNLRLYMRNAITFFSRQYLSIFRLMRPIALLERSLHFSLCL